MLRAIPTYDSMFPTKFQRWLDQLDQLFSGEGCDMPQICWILGIKLIGLARANMDLDISKHGFKSTLDTPDRVDLVAAFRQICQNGRSLQDYNAKFRGYLFNIKQVPDTQDVDLIQRYCNGLVSKKDSFCTNWVAKMRDRCVSVPELLDPAQKFVLNLKNT